MIKKEQEPIALLLLGIVAFGATGYGALTGQISFSSVPPQQAAAVQPSLPTAVAVPFVEIAHGSQSTVTEPTNDLITSSDELASLWKMVSGAGAMPTVDFSRTAVLAVFEGQTTDQAAKISVASVSDSSSERHVVVTITDSGVACTGTCPMIEPYQIVEVPLSNLPLTSEYTFVDPNPKPEAITPE